MKPLLQILFFLLTWFNLSATPAFSKVALPNYAVSFPNTATQKLESEVKIGVSNFARSGILENSFSQKAILWESYVLENRAREGNVNVVTGAVNTSQSYINVTITDLVCLKRENDKAMQTGPVLQLIVHGLKESAVANKDIVLDYVKWYAHDNIINQLIENPPPPNSCFIGGKNQAHYQNILSVLDAVSTALAPTGLDAFFDAGTAVYCLTQGETSDALLYSAAFVIPAASGGMVKGAVNGTHYFYLTIKEGKLKIPSLGTSCPMAGVGFNVAKQTNKKIYSTIANSASYNKLLTLKNDPDYTSFIVHIDDALDNTQLSSKLREGPKEVEDYFTYYKANKNKPAAEIVSGFVKGAGRHANWVEITGITQKVEDLIPHVLKVETDAGNFISKTIKENGADVNLEGFQGCHTENALKEYVQTHGGTYEIKNTSMGAGGVYDGQPIIKLNGREYVKTNGTFVEYEAGKWGGTSTFFPEGWPDSRILEEVKYAVENNHGLVPGQSSGGNLMFGFSKDGIIEIRFAFNANGKGTYYAIKK